MFKYARNLPFAYDSSSLFLPWIMMLMVMLATLALAGTLSVNNMLEHWNSSMSGSLTVQVMPSSIKSRGNIVDNTMEEVDRAVAVVKEAKGVKSARALEVSELQKLLKPWLGDTALEGDIPLPRLIDVEIDETIDFDVESLQKELQKYAPNASVDVHRIWLEKLSKLANTIKISAFVVLGLVLFTALATVVYATITSLAVHRPAIEILHLIGAKDTYIAYLFSKRTLLFSFVGALLGTMIAMLLVFLVGNVLAMFEEGLITNGSLDTKDWSFLLFLPLVAALISGLSAYVTVNYKLKRSL